MSVRILRPAEVDRLTGLSKSVRYDLESKGQFPQRRRLSDRASGYFEHEIEEWLQNRPIGDDAPTKAATNSPKRKRKRQVAGNPHADKRVPD